MNVLNYFNKNNHISIINTETIPGLSGLYTDPIALKSILDLKQRAIDFPISILVSSLDMAQQVGLFDTSELSLATKLWPWATIVVNKNPTYKHPKTPYKTIGIRMTSIPSLQKIIEEAKQPIFSTSVNVHGQPFATNMSQAESTFNQSTFNLPAFSPSDLTYSTKKPSCIVDITQSPLVISRAENCPNITQILQDLNLSVIYK